MQRVVERLGVAILLAVALFGSDIPLAGAAGVVLTMQRLGTGTGTLTSSPTGIGCGIDCAESYPTGTVVTISATTSGGYALADWGGACNGVAITQPCSVTMDVAKTVQATFMPYADLTVTQARTPNPVAVGQVLSYVLTVGNIGSPNTAHGVVVVDTLPMDVTVQAMVPSQGTCTVSTAIPAIVTCALGSLAFHAVATVRVDVIPSRTLTLTSTVSVTASDTFDAHIRSNWSSTATSVGALSKDPVIMAAGDIACDPAEISYNQGIGSPKVGASGYCQQKFTADIVRDLHAKAVLALGDLQYVDGRLDAFQQSYATTWGLFRNLTHPVVGNHEYNTPSAAGYFDYFGAAAGTRGQGYYSFDVGTWHLIALNSNCTPAGGCGAGSPQEQWLRADLAAHPAVCTLAFWHHPFFKSGVTESTAGTRDLWTALYQANADLILNGHEHMYERFAAQTPAGAPDPTRGLREFIVGTGGRNHGTFSMVAANSEVRNADTFGVMKLVLHPSSYDWEFVAEAGSTFTDSGTTACH